MSDLLLPFYNGIQVIVSNTLPVEQTTHVCDIETREEFIIKTGELIECLEVNGKLLVSQDLFNRLKKWLK